MFCFKRWFGTALMTMCTATAVCASAVETWRPYDITLRSTVRYTNPYKDVSVFAVFTGPDGTVMEMPGFWDGEDMWRVRFAPPKPGRWQFRTRSTDTSNAGLNGRQGKFIATTYSGQLAIYRLGFLRVSANQRYLTYGDGTPFYWLGDTNWGGFSRAEPLDRSNVPGTRSMFHAIVDRRVQQGYTVWKAETFANNNEPGNYPVNEGGEAWVDGKFFDRPNVEFWRNVDERVRYVADQGLVLAIAQGIGRSLQESVQTEDHKRLARYILARYGAFPTVWLTAQEYNDLPGRACADCWARIAADVYALDPYKRPNSLHSWVHNPIRFHDQAWYRFVTLQQGHGKAVSVDYWLEQYAAMPARPVLEDEANYERLIPLYGGTGTSEGRTRQAAWMSQVGGAFGFTYGGQGIWFGCYEKVEANSNCGAGKDGYAWFEALEFPVGGRQLAYMKAFWTALPWWTLGPDGEAIRWNHAPTDTQKPYQKANADRTIIVVYLPEAPTAYTGRVRGLNRKHKYRARWFDPRLGTYTPIAEFGPGASGWDVPAAPSTEDWVLLIQAG